MLSLSSGPGVGGGLVASVCPFCSPCPAGSGVPTICGLDYGMGSCHSGQNQMLKGLASQRNVFFKFMQRNAHVAPYS